MHEAVGFQEDADDAGVVGEVVERERAGFAVFQPFLRGLVAADCLVVYTKNAH